MNRFLIFTIALLSLCSCSNPKVKIKGRLIGAESTTIYLESVGSLETVVIDSVSLSDDGRFTISFDASVDELSLYNIVCSGERIPLFLEGGDKVAISSLGEISIGYRVEGSEESEILRQFYQPYFKGVRSLNTIANEYASTELTEEERRDLAQKYATEYQTIKQEQLRFVIENKSTMAAVYALFQRLPGDIYLFNGDTDVIYLRTVADALEESYPQSTYLRSLRNSIAQMEININLRSNITERSFPEIELPDMHSENIALSSLSGKVILLEFWSAELANSNPQNADLKDIYSKYRDRDFEIYQVSVDTSKSFWISSVQEQRLGWISVCDLRGTASPSLGIYNVSKLPSNFLIDREGTIIGRDLRGEELQKAIEKLL